MPSFRDLLRSALDLMAQRARVPFHAHALHPWIELAEGVGPVSSEGPSTHSLLLPAKRDGASYGLNVFQHAKAIPFDDCAKSFAKAFLGSDEHVTEVLAIPGIKAHGGVLCTGGSLRLKLYFSEGLNALEKALSLEPAGADAFGVDVTSEGLCRARRYLRVDDPASKEGFLPGRPSVSHRLLTQLEGDGQKVTYNTIFLPSSPATELSAFARAADDSGFDHHLVTELSTLADAAGHSLRAVAHEVDAYADGTRSTDALVALGG